MESDYLGREINNLWSKVQEKSDRLLSGTQPDAGLEDYSDRIGNRGFRDDFGFDRAEFQAESLNLSRTRFQKERSYLEKLIESKNEEIGRLQKEIEKEQERNLELKSKIQELNNSQSMLVQQSFSTVELQSRSLNVHIEKVTQELKNAREEALKLKYDLQEEKTTREKDRSGWGSKENEWLEERGKRMLELEQIKQDLFQQRQKELEEVSRLESTIRDLQDQLFERKTMFEKEKMEFQNLLKEKENQITISQQNFRQAKSRLEDERDGRRNQSNQNEIEKKRLMEELANRENKIKELQESLEESTQAGRFSSPSESRMEVQPSVSQNRSELPSRRRDQSRSFFTEAIHFLSRKMEFVLVIAISLIFVGMIFFLWRGSGSKSYARAQKFLEQGNEQFTDGDLKGAKESLQKAYKISPDNAAIKNSLILVLGEIANKEFKEGKFEDALERVELLNQLLPEDSDVVRLRNNILHALSREE